MSKKRRFAIVLGAIAFVIAGGLTAIGFFYYAVSPIVVEGPSMEPGWVDGDRVIVSRPVADLRPGDVVIFESPDTDELLVMKRVIGVAGDEIDLDGFFVMRNGEPIVADRVDSADGFICFEEVIDGRVFRTKRDPLTPTSDLPPITVPAGHVYLLGDHRGRSNDSRSFGTVPVERIVGIVGEHDLRVEPRDPCEGP
ncbi:MAG: signal peptidase I [Deltaproteobacteria bacterium]|nr:signal peptidase I [Deltaproteobacteria bacterium]